MNRSHITVAAGILYLGAVGCCLADSFTFDLRATGRLEFPAWIPDRPLAVPKTQAELSFPVVPGSDDDDLALTVVFQEEIGGFHIRKIPIMFPRDSRISRFIIIPNCIFEMYF